MSERPFSGRKFSRMRATSSCFRRQTERCSLPIGRLQLAFSPGRCRRWHSRAGVSSRELDVVVAGLHVHSDQEPRSRSLPLATPRTLPKMEFWEPRSVRLHDRKLKPQQRSEPATCGKLLMRLAQAVEGLGRIGAAWFCSAMTRGNGLRHHAQVRSGSVLRRPGSPQKLTLVRLPDVMAFSRPWLLRTTEWRYSPQRCSLHRALTLRCTSTYLARRARLPSTRRLAGSHGDGYDPYALRKRWH
jgi:hypothetical protein